MTPRDEPVKGAAREQTRTRVARAAVVAAATELFTEHGYVATTVEAISERSGVPAPTVYRLFAGKIGILQAVLDASIGGDDQDVAVQDRPNVAALFTDAEPAAMIAGVVAVTTGINRRSNAVYHLLAAAAASDAAAARLLAAVNEQRRNGQRQTHPFARPTESAPSRTVGAASRRHRVRADGPRDVSNARGRTGLGAAAPPGLADRAPARAAACPGPLNPAEPRRRDSVWLARTVELTDSFQWQGRTIACGRAGTGPDVVFCHGTPWSSYVWSRYADALSNDFTVHLWDMPGYGQSSKEPEHAVDFDAQAKAFAALLEHWQLDHPHVVAHDFGGAVSLRATLVEQARYASLLLVDVVAIPPCGSPFFRFVQNHPSTLDELPPYIHEAIVRAYIQGASHLGLRDADLGRLLEPWTGAVGQPAFYPPDCAVRREVPARHRAAPRSAVDPGQRRVGC